VKYLIFILATILTQTAFAQAETVVRYEANRVVRLNNSDTSDYKILDGYRLIQINFKLRKLVIYGTVKEFDLDMVSKIEETIIKGRTVSEFKCLDQSSGEATVSLIFKNDEPETLIIRYSTVSFIYYIYNAKT
jgi:hypothetical protein